MKLMRTLLFSALSWLAASPLVASAHVVYVAPESELARYGIDWQFLVSPLSHASNVVPGFILVLVVALGAILFYRAPIFRDLRGRFRERAATYKDLIPWMLRLGMGIALIGAGVGEVLISPAFPHAPQFIGLQVALGFLILGGFITVPATLLAMLLYGAGLFGGNGALLGNLEFFTMGIAILASGNLKPGVDDLLGIRASNPAKSASRHIPLLLRIGVGGSMLFSAIYEKFFHPHASAYVVEAYNLHALIPVDPGAWVLGAGLTEALLGLLLIFGVGTRLVATISFFMISLTFFYFGEDVYSHVTLFASLSALVVLGGGSWSLINPKDDIV